MSTSFDYNRLDNLLHELMSSLGSKLTPDEVKEVTEYVDAGEYGLALETLADLLVEEGKTISFESFAKIEYLANEMGNTSRVLAGGLRSRIRDD